MRGREGIKEKERVCGGYDKPCNNQKDNWSNAAAAFGHKLAVHSNGIYGWDHGGYNSGVAVGFLYYK